MSKYTGPVCRGSWALGTACKRCERCIETKPSEKQDMGVVTQADIDAAQGYIDAFNRDGINSKHKLAQHFAAHRLASQADHGETYRHIKRGTTYTVIGLAELQMAQDSLVDGSSVVVYRGDDWRLWVREEGEFHDGRFEKIATHPQPSQKGEGDE